MSKRNIRWGALGATAAVALSAFAPLAARANDTSTQNQKNLMRDLAIGAGALGVYGLANHNSTLGLLGLAGAAVAGSQYEKDRHQQSQDNARDHYYYYRHNPYNNNNRDYEYRGNRY